MSPLITLSSVSAATPDGRLLFENLTLAFGPERTGLVGRNGVGKTSLLQLLSGEAAPRAGDVSRVGRIGLLRQVVVPDPDARLADLLGVRAELDRLARIEAGQGVEADLADADWTLPSRMASVLAEVGLAEVDSGRPVLSLSGGQATRAALAALLLAQPDMLLLDEPTNNLDAEAQGLVARILRRWRGGAVVVSHDRALLGEMDRIVELSSLGARVYGGGYDLYAARKAEEAAAAERDLAVAERESDRTAREAQAAVERQAKRDAAGRKFAARGSEPKILLGAQAERAENTGARGARLAERRREGAAEDLAEARARVERIRALAFDLPSSGLPPGRAVLAFDDVTFAWPGAPPLIEGLTFRIAGPERLAVAGANGSGKSTLIRLAIGDLVPTSGAIQRGVAAVILDQRVSLLRDGETILQAYRRLNPRADANAAHAALAKFLFRNSAAHQSVGSLSGGERLRAGLACVLAGTTPPQLLILDEPTNHLDLDSIRSVEQALAGYDGALMVVSHDRAFIEAIGVRETLWLPAKPL